MELKKATRKQVKLRLGISAISGGGKTYSALLLAKGLVGNWEKICVIDTENESASLYSHLGDYNTIVLNAPYSPERYIQAIKTAEDAGMECIIVDSITHEWDGKGGILDLHSQIPGNSFTNWATMTPRHQKFIDSILQSKCHVVTAVRRKTEYEMTKEGGKTKVEKAGLKEITRDGFEYELTVNFNLDERHNCTTSKDRTGLFSDKPFFTITEQTGEDIIKWCNDGTKVLPEIMKTLAEKIDDAKEILINSTKETIGSDWKSLSKDVKGNEELKSFCNLRMTELGITK